MMFKRVLLVLIVTNIMLVHTLSLELMPGEKSSPLEFTRLRRMNGDLTFEFHEELVCDDTKKKVYQLVDSSKSPQTNAEAQAVCNMQGMHVCGIREIEPVVMSPARHWHVVPAIMEVVTAKMYALAIDSKPLNVMELPESHGITSIHCCGSELFTCANMSSPKPVLETVKSLSCKDTGNTVYKYVKTNYAPAKVTDVNMYCGVDGMTLCTLEDLVSVFESPARTWETRWSFVDAGTDQRRDALVENVACNTISDTCYKMKIRNTSNVSTQLKLLNCCTKELQSCKSWEGVSTSTTKALPTTTKALPTTTKALPTTTKALPTTTKALPTTATPRPATEATTTQATMMAAHEVVVVVDVPLEAVPELFK